MVRLVEASSRREFLSALTLAAAGVGVGSLTGRAIAFAAAQVTPSSEALLNVQSLGAAGDGRTDDSSSFRYALARAVSEGARGLYIPPGVYRMTTPIDVETNDLHWQGAGMTRSHLTWTESEGAGLRIRGQGRQRGFQLRHLSIEGPKRQGLTGLSLLNADRCLVEHCGFSGWETSIDLEDSLSNLISRCYLQFSDTGVRLRTRDSNVGSNGNWIHMCEFYNHKVGGVNVEGGSGNWILTSWFENLEEGSSGTHVTIGGRNATNVNVCAECAFGRTRKEAAHAVVVGGSASSLCVGNRILSNWFQLQETGGSGVVLGASRMPMVDGNVLLKVGSVGKNLLITKDARDAVIGPMNIFEPQLVEDHGQRTKMLWRPT